MTDQPATTRWVLLPGLDGTGRLLSSIAKELGEKRSIVVAYPNSGHHSYDDLEALVRSRVPTDGNFVLVAESFSGPIAVRLAAHPPKGTLGVVLAATFVTAPRRLLAAVPRICAKVAFSIRPPRVALRLGLLGLDVDEALIDITREAVHSVPADVLAHRLRMVADVDALDAFKSAAVPVAYIRAGDDRLVPHSVADELSAVSPGLRVYDIDGPHLILQREPEKAAVAIRAFSTSCLARSTNTDR